MVPVRGRNGRPTRLRWREVGGLPVNEHASLWDPLRVCRGADEPSGLAVGASQSRTKATVIIYPICGKHNFLRCASRPDLAVGAWRPQAQKLARDRLRLFDRRRGWGKASHIARLRRVPAWLGTGHEASKGASLGMEPHPSWDPNETDKSTVTRSRMFRNH